jgi:hypothetical protein
MRPIIEMYLCEVQHLVLRIGQPYIFRAHPLCEECTRLANVYPNEFTGQFKKED